MFRRVFVGGVILSFCAGCSVLHLTGPTPSPAQAKFQDESVRFDGGANPAPVIVTNVTYVYVDTPSDGTQVQAATDGLTFTSVPASYPAGISRTIVTLPDGRFRMYYSTGALVDVSSAISSDGLNWAVEAGTRYNDPNLRTIRAIALPNGGYRLYYPNPSAGVNSAISSDGLTFSAEGPITIPAPDGTFTWGPSAAAYVGGKYHLVLTKVPTSSSSELWHGISTDGRTWTVDKLAVNPGVPLNQPAWAISGSTNRIYYRAQPGGFNAIGSGIISF
jgi:hypothetical protein